MSENKKRIKKRHVLLFFFVLCVGFLLPEEQIIPVQGAAKNDCNLDTF